jgi:hypothetical protein
MGGPIGTARIAGAALQRARRIAYAPSNIASTRARCLGSETSSARRSTDNPSSLVRDHGVCLFGPRVRFPDDPTNQILRHASDNDAPTPPRTRCSRSTRLERLLRRIAPEPRRGRPWSCSLRRRILIACAALRTNHTLRELAAVAQIWKSTAHRVVATVTAKLAAVDAEPPRGPRAPRTIDGHATPRSWCDGAICASSMLSPVGPATGTIRCTTAGPRSRRCVCTINASWPTEATAAYRSS